MNDAQYSKVADNSQLSNSCNKLQKKNLLCQLEQQAVIKVSGNDAGQFLHGQFTNDVEALAEHGVQLNGFCDPKGRLIALFYLIRMPDSYLIVVEQSIAADVVKRLQMFVLMADVEFATTDLACLGFAQQEKPCPESLSSLALAPLASIESQGLIVARLDDKIARYLIIGDQEQLANAWQDIATESLACDESVWRLLDIQLGVPTIVEKTQGCFVPQMMNLDLINGLSFNKGCYPGQEVVARMHHLGKLKRRMYRLRILSEEQPLPGDGIYSTESATSESVGKIVSAVAVDDNGFEALAVLLIKHKEDPSLYLDDGADTRITLLNLPYKIKTSA